MAVRGYIYDSTRNRNWINKSLNNATERDTLAFDAPFVRHVNLHVRSTYPRHASTVMIASNVTDIHDVHMKGPESNVHSANNENCPSNERPRGRS